ncbi:MAG: toll/interleukin-1 receptor domain-containing protein, partial [bacterium]|nr:toll/interleukin-1 receptor domain-containing protein [bacterium]
MKLFISYAHVDVYQVRQLVDLLRAGGHETWFDHSLIVGQDWKQQLYDAIKSCEGFVYALTPESVASEWCQWEFGQAVEMGKPIFPVLMQARTQLPDTLNRFQYADFTEGPTPQGIAKLMGGLNAIRISPKEIHTPENPKGV